jgi:hypothetical protein
VAGCVDSQRQGHAKRPTTFPATLARMPTKNRIAPKLRLPEPPARTSRSSLSRCRPRHVAGRQSRHERDVDPRPAVGPAARPRPGNRSSMLSMRLASLSICSLTVRAPSDPANPGSRRPAGRSSALAFACGGGWNNVCARLRSRTIWSTTSPGRGSRGIRRAPVRNSATSVRDIREVCVCDLGCAGSRQGVRPDAQGIAQGSVQGTHRGRRGDVRLANLRGARRHGSPRRRCGDVPIHACMFANSDNAADERGGRPVLDRTASPARGRSPRWCAPGPRSCPKRGPAIALGQRLPVRRFHREAQGTRLTR